MLVALVSAAIGSTSTVTTRVLLNEIQSRHSSLRLASFRSPVFVGQGLRNARRVLEGCDWISLSRTVFAWKKHSNSVLFSTERSYRLPMLMVSIDQLHCRASQSSFFMQLCHVHTKSITFLYFPLIYDSIFLGLRGTCTADVGTTSSSEGLAV